MTRSTIYDHSAKTAYLRGSTPLSAGAVVRERRAGVGGGAALITDRLAPTA
jgi:hypothetical protein